MKHRAIFITAFLLILASCQINSGQKATISKVSETLFVLPTHTDITTPIMEPAIIAVTVETKPNAKTPVATIINPSTTAFCPNGQVHPLLEGIIMSYVMEKQIWLWCEGKDSSIAVASNSSTVSLSDDGKLVAFTHFSGTTSGYFDLSIFSIEDGEKKLLLDASTLSELVTIGPEGPSAQIFWIPGTHLLLLSDGAFGKAFKINADTEEITKFDTIMIPGYVHISPDGKSVLLVTPTEIYLGDINTNSLKNVLRFEEISVAAEGHYDIEPVWSQDSRSVSIAIPLTPAGEVGSVRIWNIGLVDQQPKLTAEYENNTYDNFVSPDQKWVMYVKRDDPHSDLVRELHLRKINSGMDLLLSKGNVDFIDWAPDASRFSFYEKTGNNRDYYVGSINGEDVTIEQLPLETTLMTFIDSERFLTDDLQLRSIGGGEHRIGNGRFSDYDFKLINR